MTLIGDTLMSLDGASLRRVLEWTFDFAYDGLEVLDTKREADESSRPPRAK